MQANLILIVISLTIGSQVYSQGLIDGFFKGKGNGVIALSASYQTASNYWAGTREIKLARNQPNAGIFVNYGIFEGLDVVANVPFVNLAPQDASLFLKWRIIYLEAEKGGRFTLGLAGGMSTPMMDYNTESSTAIGQQATSFEPRVVAQYHFANRFFIQAQAGYTYSLDPVPSGVPASAKIGYTADEWYAELWFDYRDSETGADYTGVGERRANSFRELEVDYQRIGGSFYKPMNDKYGVSLGLDYTLGGRNTFRQTGINLGFIRNFKTN